MALPCSMAVTWDPEKYRRFAADRSRPFFDLLGRVRAENPSRVVDLGCGPGHLTADLTHRWPAAQVLGIDSSPEMIAVAPRGERLAFELGDIRSWHPEADVDVLISNAALQWVPGHSELLAQWADALPRGACMAWQVPGNFQAPSHAALLDLASSARWAVQLADALRFADAVATPMGYAEILLNAGWSADCWETTYVHVLPGDDAVLEWVRGTTLGPIRAALTPAESVEFEQDYAARLRAAYPARSDGTLFPFRRIFAVGVKP